MKTEAPFLEIAIQAAKRAGAIHLKYFDTDLEIKTKSAHFDLVTNADVESEDAIVSFIKERFPDHNVIAEEKKYATSGSPYMWIIDPLDGTSNFSHRIPIFAVSIALAFHGTVILGIVYDTMKNELFQAEKGKGAFKNGTPIRVSRTGRIEEAMLITGFYYDRNEKMLRALNDVKEFLMRGIVGIRRFGAAALDLASVACGRADGFWEFTLNPWDFAAGKLIVEEAGGMVTDNKGDSIGIEPSYIVSSNGILHNVMLDVLR
jgi:myo-inositol-1(or 4)-monophosphatase